jgi:thymidylate synthase
MSTDVKGTCAGDLYVNILHALRDHGELVPPLTTASSPSVARETVELIGTRFDLVNPQYRIIETPARPLNLGFLFGNFFYNIRAVNDVASMAYYNPIAAKFSDDGVNLHGAYGPRIIQQLRSVVRLLQQDPSTRRAVVSIYDGRQDHVDSRDIPCPISMQFLVRHGVLHCLTSFRSQNIVMVYPYDIFLFTMLHEWVAVQAGIPLGMHYQHNGSVHFYENEATLVHEIVKQPCWSHAMPAMTKPDEYRFMKMMTYERELREWGSQIGPEPAMPDLDYYWIGIAIILKAFAKVKLAGIPHMREYSLLKQCWP